MSTHDLAEPVHPDGKALLDTIGESDEALNRVILLIDGGEDSRLGIFKAGESLGQLVELYSGDLMQGG